jgi:hypothetical protein
VNRSIVLLLAFALSGCGQSPGEKAMADLSVMMRDEARQVRSGVGLHDIFTDCSTDCSGHRAGYLWALERPAIAVSEDCPVERGHSFYHGCVMGIRAASVM